MTLWTPDSGQFSLSNLFCVHCFNFWIQLANIFFFSEKDGKSSEISFYFLKSQNPTISLLHTIYLSILVGEDFRMLSIQNIQPRLSTINSMSKITSIVEIMGWYKLIFKVIKTPGILKWKFCVHIKNKFRVSSIKIFPPFNYYFGDDSESSCFAPKW